MERIFSVDGLTGGYGQEPVINKVSFHVDQGDFLGIIGPNGSGKSTLIRFMGKLLPYTEGSVRFKGREVSRIPQKEFCRTCAFVPQNTGINFTFSAEEIVLMGRIPHLARMQHEAKKDRDIAYEAMELTETFHLKGKDITELSAGERQRVLIARALAQEPEVLFLDEPTSHLDIGHQVKVMDMLRRRNREKRIAVVMIIHDLNLAAEYCRRLILLKSGRVYKEGDPVEVLSYQHIEKVYETVVVVHENPMNGKPYVILVPEEEQR